MFFIVLGTGCQTRGVYVKTFPIDLKILVPEICTNTHVLNIQKTLMTIHVTVSNCNGIQTRRHYTTFDVITS